MGKADMPCEKRGLLIIIPAYNEEANITRTVEELEARCPQYDYVVVNDGSEDATGAALQRRHYSHINLPLNTGIGGAVQTGYCYARDNGYEYAVQIDGDGQHDVRYLPEMLRLVESGEAEVVIGSRFVKRGAEGYRSSVPRRIGITFLSFLGLLLTGRRVRDITSGYRLVNRRFIEVFAKDYPLDYPEPEAMILTVLNQGKIIEYPVVMRERAGGESSITIRRAVYYMFKVPLAMLIRRISLGIRR